MNLKRLVLGTAAGALAVTGAHAADLPVAVEPVEYVRICDAYGAGFFYIPGTETCLRVAGRIRVDYNVFFDFAERGDGRGADSRLGFEDTDDQGYRFRSRGYIRLDSRTATEFGLLRTYLDTNIQVESSARGNGANTRIAMDNAFIQFGGLTFGKTQTFFGYSGGIYTAEQFLDLGGSNTSEVVVLAYTFAFGNGFSASIALEDNTDHRINIGRWTGQVGNDGKGDFRYGGAQIPDVVGNVRLDQGWGSVQVMAAGHYVNGIAELGPFRKTEEKYGFAVGGGVEVNVPFGNGTSVGVQGGYAKGALDYIYDGRSYDDGIDGAVDAVWDRRGDLELGDFWTVAGGFTTSFTPTITFAAGAGYTNLDNAGNFDSELISAQGWLAYEPVSDFQLGVGVEYQHVENGFSQDGDLLTVLFRAERNF